MTLTQEQKINIRAADYRFVDKVKFYKGYINSRGYEIEGTKIEELLALSKKSDFIEEDIEERKIKIIDGFISYLKDYDLIKE